MAAEPIPLPPERITDRVVLLVISGGLIGILLSIIIGLFLASRPGFALPNWAENVLVAIATASALKLGDCLSTLVALSTGRSAERLTKQLGNAGPPPPPEPDPDAPPAKVEVVNPASKPANVKVKP